MKPTQKTALDNDAQLLYGTVYTFLYSDNPKERLAALRAFDDYEPTAILLAAQQVKQPA